MEAQTDDEAQEVEAAEEDMFDDDASVVEDFLADQAEDLFGTESEGMDDDTVEPVAAEEDPFDTDESAVEDVFEKAADDALQYIGTEEAKLLEPEYEEAPADPELADIIGRIEAISRPKPPSSEDGDDEATEPGEEEEDPIDPELAKILVCMAHVQEPQQPAASEDLLDTNPEDVDDDMTEPVGAEEDLFDADESVIEDFFDEATE